MLTESYIWISLAKVFYMNPHFIACESLAAFGEALHMIDKPESNTSYILLTEQTDSFKSKQEQCGRTPRANPALLHPS